MLNQNDLDYLKWIAQRLVNRYREDPKILVLVDEIIFKIIAEISTYKKHTNFIVKSLPLCIKTMQDIYDGTNKLPQITHNNATQITISKNTETFENINISEILK
jgi:hypothetical protein